MPKRTNDFQTLIKFIYDRITPADGTVTESAMIYDKDSNTLREVDILIEHKISGHTIKIAVECRDRSRKDTIEWIDGLVGKTSSLNVDKVVAVSKKGFLRLQLIRLNLMVSILSQLKRQQKKIGSLILLSQVLSCCQMSYTHLKMYCMRQMGTNTGNYQI